MYAALYAPGNLPLLLDCAQKFSPLIEVTSSDVVTFDIRGLGRTIGTVDQIASAIERTVGIPARLAIASNADTANYLAKATEGVTIVPRGQEAEYLASLSLLHLDCPLEMGEVLAAWGIHTFGEFAQLPPLGIAARLGAEGVYWHEQVRGIHQRQLRILQEPVRLFREQDFDDALTNLEPLLFLVSRFLVELCLEMKTRFLATNEIRIALELDDRSMHTFTLRLPVPMQQHRALLKLVQLEFEQRSPNASICKLQLELEPVAPKTTQEELFDAAYPAPEQVELTLARVRQIVGVENIGSPKILDSHLPDSFILRPFVATGRRPYEQTASVPSLAFRRFRPPEPAQVKVVRQPEFVTSRLVRGAVRAARGPWFTSGHWWAKDAWSHEEWDVAFQNNALYRIFRDLQTNAWFVEGNYD